jgi:antirestriction protein ArdC
MSLSERQSLYGDVTNRIIAELEAGRLPWVQPWDKAKCPCTMPANAVSQRPYSGINVLILWAAAMDHGFASQRWLTFRQAMAAGGHVRRGEKGTVVCYADRFVPRADRDRAQEAGSDARTIAFLKRFTVFNLDQCEDLPDDLAATADFTSDPVLSIAEADRLIAGTGAYVRIGGPDAYYVPALDYVQVPPQAAYREPVDWYRTVLHELGHWTGHASRLGRDQKGTFGSVPYGREELVAEMSCAFTCAALGITPTVRHADYIGAWLTLLKEDEKAIFRAASGASKAADFLLGKGEDQ